MRFAEEIEQPQMIGDQLQPGRGDDVKSPNLKALEGRSVADIAGERGKDLSTLFLDLAIEDNLETRVRDNASQRSSGWAN